MQIQEGVCSEISLYFNQAIRCHIRKEKSFMFCVLLTVHISIILVINQLNAQNLVL